MTLFDAFCERFLSSCIQEEKKIAVGGFDFRYAYFAWLLKRLTQRNVDMLFDREACIPGLKIYRELALKDLDTREFVGYAPGDRSYEDLFRKNGMETVCLSREMGPENFGFYEWVEAQFGADLVQTVPGVRSGEAGKYTTPSGPSRQMGLFDVLDTIRTENMSILDVGSGKGGAAIIMTQFPFKRVDGLEIDPELCKISRQNMEKTGTGCTIINESAADFGGYGDYDVLYLYDPFRGEMFNKVMNRIEMCVKKSRKQITMIYANPHHHQDVIRNGVFAFERNVDTDFFHRDVKIYKVRSLQ